MTDRPTKTLAATASAASIVPAASRAGSMLDVWWRSIRPSHLAMTLIVGATVAANVSPINDRDSFWHVALGREVIAGRTLNPSGTQWVADPSGSWSTTQWASETAMAVLVDLGGWRALVIARAVAFTAILVTLAVTLSARRATAPVVAVLAITGTATSLYVQDRPQTVAMVGMVVLGWLCVRTWTWLVPPSAWAVATLAFLWAQFHGTWLLVPGAFLLAAAGLAADARRDSTSHYAYLARRCLLAAGASMAGLVNPLGLASFVAPLRFTDAATSLTEWRPPTIIQPVAAGCVVLIALTVAGWLKTRGRILYVEIAWVVAWGCFATAATRNDLPAIFALAPVAVAAVDRAWGARLRSLEAENSPREARLLRMALIGSIVAAVVITAAMIVRVDPLGDAPVKPLAQRLAAQPTPMRVFDDYDSAGQLVAFGGGNVRLIVDGRFDRWGAARVQQIIRAQELGTGWEATVSDFHPDAFVLTKTAPLATLLVREGHWRVAQTSDRWVLLLRPDPPLR